MKENIDKREIIVIEFRRKREIKELNGLFNLDYPTNSVNLKKELYN